ncbi:MAG: hypothetical protein PVF59_04885 [Desulfobacterales bacterium]
MTSGSGDRVIRHQVLDGRLVEYIEHRLVHPRPQGGESTIFLKGTLHFGDTTLAFGKIGVALKKPDNAADGYFLRLAQEEITAVITAFGIDQTAAFELSKDNFQKSQGNRLRLGNFGDLDRPRSDPSGKLNNGAEGILISLGEEHPPAFLTYLVGKFLDFFSRESENLST